MQGRLGTPKVAVVPVVVATAYSYGLASDATARFLGLHLDTANLR